LVICQGGVGLPTELQAANRAFATSSPFDAVLPLLYAGAMTIILRPNVKPRARIVAPLLCAALVSALVSMTFSILQPTSALAQTTPKDPLGDLFRGDRQRPFEPWRSRPRHKRPPQRFSRPDFSNPRDKLDLTPGGQLNSAPDVATRKKTLRDKQQDAERLRRQRRALLRRNPRQHVPENADERDKLLQTLYGFLAKAKTRTLAKQIKVAIEHVWASPGSDTVALLMRRALLAGKAKHYNDALKFLGYVVTIAPDYAEGWNQRAYVYFKQKKLSLALGDLRRVLALDPKHYKALQGLGRLLREIDEKRAALKVYRALLKVYPLSESAQQAVRHLSHDVEGKQI